MKPRAGMEAVGRLSRVFENAWFTNGVLLILGLLQIQLCRDGVIEFQHFVHGFSFDVFGQLMLYLAAFALIQRGAANKWTLPVIFTVAVLARMVCVFHPAFLSSDVYRYVWDGQVQAAGINPFRYIPADSHLAFLRDGAMYPHINRRDYAHTIYPPGAQAIFFAVTRISPTEPFMKLAMVGFEAVTSTVLMRMLTLLQLPRERILLYAWNPLCFWEIASSGHVDAAALTLIALGLYALLRDKPAQAGGWLGAATLVKLYPAALLPAVLALPFRRREGRIVAALTGTVLLGYACYGSVGRGVVGFLPEYANEEGIESGSRYFPLTFTNGLLHAAIPAAAYLAFCAVVLLLLAVWAVRRGSQPQACIFSALVMATALTLCFAPHYPWYFLWLLPCLTLYPWRPAFFLVVASTFLFSSALGAPGAPLYLLNKLLYGGFIFFLAYDVLQQRFMLRGRSAEEPDRRPRASILKRFFTEAREL